MKITGKAEAGHDVLLPVARREGCVRRQKDKAFAVSDHNRRLAFRMTGHIDQLDALVSEQIDDPMVRAERRTTVKRALHGVLDPEILRLPGLVHGAAGPYSGRTMCLALFTCRSPDTWSTSRCVSNT